MSYATKADMILHCGEQELIELTDRPDPATGATTRAIVDEVLDLALADADREINRYLAGRMGGAVAADMVVDAACRIARHSLYVHEAPPRVRELYEDAVASLAAMAKGGRATANAEGSVAQPGSAEIVFQSAGSVFSRSNRYA